MRNLIILLLLLISTGIIAQDYDEQIKIGNNHLANNLYEEAIDAYLTAQILEPTKIDNIRKKVKGVYLKINNLKDTAITLNKQLKLTIVELDSTEKIAIRARDTAVIERNKALRQAAIVKADFETYLAQVAIENGEFEKALKHAALARHKIDSVGVFRADIYETLGAAVYKARKIVLDTSEYNIEAIQSAPNGQFIVVTRANNEVILLDTPKRIIKHKKAILSTAIDFSATKILTCSADHTAQLIDLSKDTTVLFDKHSDEVLGGTFSKNGSLVVTWSRDNKTLLWDNKGDTIATLGSHKGNIYQVEFSPNESRIATRSSDLTVKLWDKKGKYINTLKHQSYIYQTKFSPDSLQLLTCSADKTAKLWDMEGNSTDTLTHKAIVLSGQFSKNGEKIMTISQDSQLTIWSIKGQKKDSIILSHKSQIAVAWFSKDGKKVVASENNYLKLWDIPTRTFKKIGTHQAAIKAIFFDKKQQYLLTQDVVGEVRLWDFMNHRLLMMLAHHGNSDPQFSPDSTSILTSSDGKTVERTPIPDIIYQQLKNNF